MKKQRSGPILPVFFISMLLSEFVLVGCQGRDGATNFAADIGQSGTPLSLEAVARRDVDKRANVIVVFTDDQGYADIGANGVLTDIQTPHIDQLAADGIRMTSGYVTAPQCTPSRAGLMTGQYQQRFGLDDNRYTPMPLSQMTMADHLQNAGYRTGMAGKWHLEIDKNSSDFDVSTLTREQRTPYFPDKRGFEDVYFGYQNTWWTNFDLNGRTVALRYRRDTRFRLDIVTQAGLAFIERHKKEPFFLYLSYYAPHVPLEATDEYLSRHQSVPEVRRRHGLAMMSAIDDGVGQLRELLADNQLSDNTLIFFISDNGAPIGIDRLDLPISDSTGIWDGSLNTPWVGEKGMLSEGGIRVPYIMAWPGTLASGVSYDLPVSTLDVAPTSLAVANAAVPAGLDGSNLMPYLKNQAAGLEERALYWRFWSQAAVRKGPWKFLQAGEREYLFNLDGNNETENLRRSYPFIALDLKQQLEQWSLGMLRPGLSGEALDGIEAQWYDYYLNL